MQFVNLNKEVVDAWQSIAASFLRCLEPSADLTDLRTRISNRMSVLHYSLSKAFPPGSSVTAQLMGRTLYVTARDDVLIYFRMQFHGLNNLTGSVSLTLQSVENGTTAGFVVTSNSKVIYTRRLVLRNYSSSAFLDQIMGELHKFDQNGFYDRY